MEVVVLHPRLDFFVPKKLKKTKVVGVEISRGSFGEHLDSFAEFARANLSSYVCCVNSHMTVEVNDDPSFAGVVNQAEFATSDGMPLTMALKWICKEQQERVAGNDLLPAMMKRAEQDALSVYFYGGKQSVLDAIAKAASSDYPNLKVVGLESPPFRAITEEEMNDTANRINTTGAQIVFVSLGCPKQERWMAAMHGKVNAIMLGVGGAFLLIAGQDSRAPKWMRDLCLEWAYRLALEPGRLWKRYLVTNSIFVWLVFKDWMSRFKRPTETASPIPK